ncbi:T9SS type A sorting domain-containing protein [bacterium SCSIO 12643]|nr:T9SS type A sorting domain-containing protein [bacterium SCSIO 12643]
MKKVVALNCFVFCLFISVNAQMPLPYYNNFDSPSDTVGWSHYALTGTDEWEWGAPTGTKLNTPFSSPNVWGTNLNGQYSFNSKMCLETPSFDLSDTTKTYRVGIFFKMEVVAPYGGGIIEFSTDSGQIWKVLNGDYTEKYNWYNVANCYGHSGPAWCHANFASYNPFVQSFHSLDTVSGESDVRFRFKFGGHSNSFTGEGWVIDNFTIEEDLPNVYAVQSHPFKATKECTSFDINTFLFYNKILPASYINKTDYYWSLDTVFDTGDTLIATKSANVQNSGQWDITIPMPQNISSGTYYIFYKVDADSVLTESYENDNLGMATLIIDTIYSVPYFTDFESTDTLWQTGGANKIYWKREPGNRVHYSGTHSGNTVWSIINSNSNNLGYLQSPHLDLSTEDSTVISFWYKLKENLIDPNYTPIKYKVGCGNTVYSGVNIPRMRNNTWDFYNAYLPVHADTSKDVRIRIYNGNASGYNGLNMVLDDIYVGKPKPDLSIEGNLKNRFTDQSVNVDTLKYTLCNTGLKSTIPTVTAFYWSTDSVLDSSDPLLGVRQDGIISDTTRLWVNFPYTKPTSSTGTYYIIYVLDTADMVDEMREYNNEGYFKLYQTISQGVPYYNDFETQIYGWRHNASFGNDNWEWTSPNGVMLDTAFSGTKVWVTNDIGQVDPFSRMHLYTPIFDFSTAINPVIEFDMKLHSNGMCHCFEAKANMSYSIDGGATWEILDTTNQSYNKWYYMKNYQSGLDQNYYMASTTELLFDVEERAFTTFEMYNGRDITRNTRYILDLSFLVGQPQVQFRYNLGTGPNNGGGTMEGAMIDNFEIREAFIDLDVEYKKSLMISSIANEIKFFMHIKNNGNYLSYPTSVNFYLSQDTVWSSSDLLIGTDIINEIQPDMHFYSNNAFNAPSNLVSYKYLLYKLDVSNTNTESNETNNSGYWPLSLDSIKSYPYMNDFNSPVINGWHQYSIDPYTNNIGAYRWRNIVAPGEPVYQSFRKSNEWSTEPQSSGSWIQNPYFYLESPAFDFIEYDSVHLSFDLLCTGKSHGINDKDGGNMEYSLDGGASWTVLNTNLGVAHNWYNSSNLHELGGPGWTGSPTGGQSAPVLDSTAIGASYFGGKKDVVFRYVYRSNHNIYSGGYVQGMRVDNFKVETFKSEYIANEWMEPKQILATNPSFVVDYSITNSGQTNGRITKTKFYWSTDSILDVNDQLVLNKTEGHIQSGTTLHTTANINYPSVGYTGSYYLFYEIDADQNIIEIDENNNTGVFVITFSPYVNYTALDQNFDTIDIQLVHSTVPINYQILNSGTLDGIPSKTSFYWSDDDSYGVGDQLIKDVNEVAITVGDTLNGNVVISYPTPIQTALYYLFYTTDSDTQIIETNEFDNWGRFVLRFDYVNSVEGNPLQESINVFAYQTKLTIRLSRVLNGSGNTQIRLFNAVGNLVFTTQTQLESGENEIMLPQNLAAGIYHIQIINGDHQINKKIMITN